MVGFGWCTEQSGVVVTVTSLIVTVHISSDEAPLDTVVLHCGPYKSDVRRMQTSV